MLDRTLPPAHEPTQCPHKEVREPPSFAKSSLLFTDCPPPIYLANLCKGLSRNLHRTSTSSERTLYGRGGCGIWGWVQSTLQEWEEGQLGASTVKAGLGKLQSTGESSSLTARPAALQRSLCNGGCQRGQEENYSNLEKIVAQASPNHKPSTAELGVSEKLGPSSAPSKKDADYDFPLLQSSAISLPLSLWFSDYHHKVHHALGLVIWTTPPDSEHYGLQNQVDGEDTDR